MVIEKNKIEIIKRIENYGARYNPNCFGGSAEDQLLACEAVAEATPIKEHHYQENERTNGNVSVNGMVNGSYKRRVNFELTQNKLQVIAKLKTCRYRNPPVEIAQLLDELFSGCETMPGWWLYVAQQWTPRVVNRVINKIIKIHNAGWKTIQNPAKYFSYLIKFRKKRKG